MNIKKYIELYKGSLGRKTATTDVDVITADNVVKVVGDAVSVLNRNRGQMKYLYDYYKGDQPAIYRTKKVRSDVNTKIVENHSFEVVRFKTSQTYGEPIQYVCKKKKASPEKNEMIDLLNDYMDDADAQARNIELGIYQSSMGTAYKAIQKEDDWYDGSDMPPFRIFIPDPMKTIIVYSSKNGKDMLSVQELRDEDGKQYFQCFSRNTYFEIKNGKVVNSGVNGFGGIPIIEYPNNAEKLSDVEVGITLFDAINELQCNRLDSVEQFVQAFMKFKNCEIDEDEFLRMCRVGAISVNDSAGGNADVDLMTAELNQSHVQTAKDDLYQNMLIIEGMPNRQQNTGGDTGQAVYLRNGWDFAEQRAKLDEPFIVEAERKTLRIVLSIIKKTSNDISINVSDLDIKITRNSTDNMLVKAQALDYLYKNKVHPLIALTICGLFSDPQKVYEMSLPLIGELYPELSEKKEDSKEVILDGTEI